MQHLIIDCQSGKATIKDFTPEEEAARLEYITDAERLQKIQSKIELKRFLVKALTELREMKANQGIFTDEDIAEKQVEVDSLRTSVVGQVEAAIASPE